MYDQLKSDALLSGIKIVRIAKYPSGTFTIFYFSFGDDWHSRTKTVFFANEDAFSFWIYGNSPAKQN